MGAFSCPHTDDPVPEAASSTDMPRRPAAGPDSGGKRQRDIGVDAGRAHPCRTRVLVSSLSETATLLVVLSYLPDSTLLG